MWWQTSDDREEGWLEAPDNSTFSDSNEVSINDITASINVSTAATVISKPPNKRARRNINIIRADPNFPNGYNDVLAELRDVISTNGLTKPKGEECRGNWKVRAEIIIKNNLLTKVDKRVIPWMQENGLAGIEAKVQQQAAANVLPQINFLPPPPINIPLPQIPSDNLPIIQPQAMFASSPGLPLPISPPDNLTQSDPSISTYASSTTAMPTSQVYSDGYATATQNLNAENQPPPPSLPYPPQIYQLPPNYESPLDNPNATIVANFNNAVIHENFNVLELRARTVISQEYFQYSDGRLKNNIRDLSTEEALEIVNKLRPKLYNLNDFGDRDVMGFIAQEIQAIRPELVQEDADHLLRVRNMEIIPVLVAAMKQQDIQLRDNSALLESMWRLHVNPLGMRDTLPLVTIQDNKLVANHQALDKLRKVDAKISLNAFCGEMKSGTSTLCNLLLPNGMKAKFKVESDIAKNTQGVWMSPPFRQEDGKFQVKLDCGATDLPNGNLLLGFQYLVSSVVVIGQKTAVLQPILEQLALVKELVQKANETTPGIIFLMRDSVLEPTIREHPCTLNAYFDYMLSTLPDHLSSVAKSIKSISPLHLMKLPPPAHADFNSSLDLLCKAIDKCGELKAERDMDGSALADFVTTCVDRINSIGPIIMMPSSADQLVGNLYDAEVERLCKAYEQSVSQNVPVENMLREYDQNTLNIPTKAKEEGRKKLKERLENIKTTNACIALLRYASLADNSVRSG